MAHIKVYSNFLDAISVLWITKNLAFSDVELNNLTDAVCHQPPVKSQDDFSFIYDNPQEQLAGVPDDVDDINFQALLNKTGVAQKIFCDIALSYWLFL